MFSVNFCVISRRFSEVPRKIWHYFAHFIMTVKISSLLLLIVNFKDYIQNFCDSSEHDWQNSISMLLICKYDWRCSYSLIINVVPSIVFVDPCILRLTSISHWHTIIHVYLLQPYLTFYYRRVRIGIQSDYLYSSFNLSFQ